MTPQQLSPLLETQNKTVGFVRTIQNLTKFWPVYNISLKVVDLFLFTSTMNLGHFWAVYKSSCFSRYFLGSILLSLISILGKLRMPIVILHQWTLRLLKEGFWRHEEHIFADWLALSFLEMLLSINCQFNLWCACVSKRWVQWHQIWVYKLGEWLKVLKSKFLVCG